MAFGSRVSRASTFSVLRNYCVPAPPAVLPLLSAQRPPPRWGGGWGRNIISWACPFNIAANALLHAHVPRATNASRANTGELSWTGGDCHLYMNQLGAGRTLQLTRAN